MPATLISCHCRDCEHPAPDMLECASDGTVRPVCPDCAADLGTCDYCGARTDSLATVNSASQDDCEVCETCLDAACFVCDGCNGTYPNNEAVRVRRDGDIENICPDCDLEYSTCCSCGGRVPDSETASYNGDSLCDSCYEEDYFTCEGCGDIYHSDDYGSDGRCVQCSRADDIQSSGFGGGVTFAEIRSRLTFGVELETSSCDGYEDLNERTCFESKDDGSISGKEFISDVLSGDEGLDAIREFCDAAKGFAVDVHCGFHLHVGVGHLSDAQRLRVVQAYKLTEPTWQAFVPASRRENGFCRPLAPSVLDAKSFGNILFATHDRYRWLNVEAFLEHGTFEVRLHGGTLNPNKVCNWVKAHTRFIDYIADLTDEQWNMFSGTAFELLALAWQDTELTEFYRDRADAFGTTL